MSRSSPCTGSAALVLSPASRLACWSPAGGGEPRFGEQVDVAGGAVDRDGAAVRYPPSRARHTEDGGDAVLAADDGGVRQQAAGFRDDAGRTIEQDGPARIGEQADEDRAFFETHGLLHRTGYAGDAADGTRARWYAGQRARGCGFGECKARTDFVWRVEVPVAVVDLAAALDVRSVVVQDLAERHEEDVVAEAAPLGDLQHPPTNEVVDPARKIAHFFAQPDEPAKAIELADEGSALGPRHSCDRFRSSRFVQATRVRSVGGRRVLE